MVKLWRGILFTALNEKERGSSDYVQLLREMKVRRDLLHSRICTGRQHPSNVFSKNQPKPRSQYEEPSGKSGRQCFTSHVGNDCT
jgi:hypothetical protein